MSTNAENVRRFHLFPSTDETLGCHLCQFSGVSFSFFFFYTSCLHIPLSYLASGVCKYLRSIIPFNRLCAVCSLCLCCNLLFNTSLIPYKNPLWRRGNKVTWDWFGVPSRGLCIIVCVNICTYTNMSYLRKR